MRGPHAQPTPAPHPQEAAAKFQSLQKIYTVLGEPEK
jgi:hypothetical protein